MEAIDYALLLLRVNLMSALPTTLPFAAGETLIVAEVFCSMYEDQLLASGLHPKAVDWCRKRAAFFIETTQTPQTRGYNI